MAKKENIILFTNSYYPVLGGIQTVCSQIAKESTKNDNFKLYVFTSKNPLKLRFIEMVEGVKVFRFLLGSPFEIPNNIKSFILLILSFLFLPLTYIHLSIMFLILKPSIVNVHFPADQTKYILPLKFFFKFKLVTSFHGHDVLRWSETSKKSSLYKDQLKLIAISD